MPTISIRAHGVSASKFQQVVNPETGEIVKLADFQPPERTATKGWTPNVARRNEQRLQQVDFDAVDGVPAFVTLTMPSGQMGDVTAAMFHGWLKRWLQYMKRHGMLHYYWILEFQASGNPHIHVLVWLDHAPEPLETYKALKSWVGILDKSDVGARLQGQIWENIDVGGEIVVDGEKVPAHPERVLMYLAKHAARGVAHYQRQIANMPEDWQYRSGRVWGMTVGFLCVSRRISRRIIRRFGRFGVWCVGGVWLRLGPLKTATGGVRLLVRRVGAYGAPGGTFLPTVVSRLGFLPTWLLPCWMRL